MSFHPAAMPSRRKRLAVSMKNMTLASLLLVSLLGSISPERDTKAEAVDAQPSSAQWNSNPSLLSSAYVFDAKGLTLRQQDAVHLNQLNFSFALIKNGRVSGNHWTSIKAFTEFITANPHILPVMSVGGWEADGFSQAAATPEGRRTFVDSAIALMQKHGFLGIDIDWEYPGSSVAGIQSRPDDKQNFTLLLADLRKGLDGLTAKDGKPRFLAIAVGGSTSFVDHIDCKAIGKIVDQVNIMTYDLQESATTTHHSNLYASNPALPSSVDAAVKAYGKAGIPRSKIMIGAAFYGRVFSTQSKAQNGLYQPSDGPAAKSYTYEKISALLAQGNFTRHFDEKARAPFLFDGRTLISYDDPVSIAAKGAYARGQGLMGMMCWQYSGDPSGVLLAAMKNSLRE